MKDPKINVEIDPRGLITRLRNGEKRLAYAAVNAINNTAKEIQRAARKRVEDVFTIRKPEFMKREAAKIKPFASVKQGRAYAEVSVGDKPGLLLGMFERGGIREPRTPSARLVAIPSVGGPARPTFADTVPAELRMKRLNFTKMKSGKPRKAVAATHTYMIDGKGIFQRVPGEAPRTVYTFVRNQKIKRGLDWEKTAKAIAARWFKEMFEREVVKAIAHDKGGSL